MLFAGSRLLPQVFSCHSNSATDNEKCATSGFAYSSQHAITEVDCAINEPRTATDKDFKQTDDSIGPVLATNAISIKQLDCGLSEGELEQLAASATDLRNGTFSGVFSSQGCPETESVDSVTFGDFPSDRELDSDLKSALSEAGLMEKQISVKDKEKNDTKSTESAPASRERRRRTRVPVSDEGEPRLQRQPKKSSTSEGRGRKAKSTETKADKPSVSVKKEPHPSRAKRGEKSADQTDKQSTEDGAEKVNDGMSLVGQTVCEICGAVVKCLKSHMLKHGDPKHKCPFCPFVSRQLQSVNIHVRRRHTNYRPHLCEECGKSFVKSTLLKEHIREKHGMLKRERRYQCSVCNYMAYTRSILARHEAKHATNRRPEFRCDVCGARLMTVHSLKEHKQLSHTDARPFPCALCGFAAKSVKRLRSHMRTHGDKSFECGICGKKFTLRPQLVRHQLVHTGDKPFACPYCSYRCAIVENLRKHCRAVHKLIYPPKKRDVRDEVCAPNVVVPLPGASMTLVSPASGPHGGGIAVAGLNVDGGGAV